MTPDQKIRKAALKLVIKTQEARGTINPTWYIDTASLFEAYISEGKK